MDVVCAGPQRRHYPEHFLVSGIRRPNPEQPGRLDALLEAARRAGHAVVEPPDCGIDPIAAVHTPEYLAFLETIHDRWQALNHASPEVIPNVHPRRRDIHYPSSPVGRAGYHMADTACPIGAQTWHSACWSAASAVHAADRVRAGARRVYALCRPACLGWFERAQDCH